MTRPQTFASIINVITSTLCSTRRNAKILAELSAVRNYSTGLVGVRGRCRNTASLQQLCNSRRGLQGLLHRHAGNTQYIGVGTISQYSMKSASGPREIEIPVPWGHLAAVEWGPPDGLPILGLHGWQDSAATFDTLAPLITDDYRFVIVDFPGHGRSSHLPKGVHYSLVNFVMAVKQASLHLGWNTFDIVAHSMGAFVGMVYASLYPKDVNRFVTIDMMYPWVLPLKKHTEEIRALVDHWVKWQKGDVTPVHTVAKAEARFLDAAVQQLTPEAARILLRRGSVVSPDGKGVSFARDRRVVMGSSMPPLTEEQALELFQHIRCELLALRAIGVEGGPPNTFYPLENEEKYMKFHQAHSSYYEYILMSGTHYVHLLEAEKVAPIILKFLNRQRNDKNISAKL